MSAIVKTSNGMSFSDKIDAMILATAKAGTRLNGMVQTCAASIVIHTVLHGDHTKADKLINALGDYARRDSLVTWFTTTGCLSIVETKNDKGKKVRSFGINKAKRDAIKAMIDATSVDQVLHTMVTGPSWSAAKKATNPMFTVDLDKAIVALIKKARKAEETKAEGSNLARLAALEQFAKINGLAVN